MQNDSILTPMGLVVAVLTRLLVPLSILRWPLGGVLASMLFDALDVVFVHLLGPGTEGEFGNQYARFDKSLDTYYLTIMLLVSLRWREALARRTAIVLYGWRLPGVTAAWLGWPNWWLLVFPNVFENFYLFQVIALKIRPGWQIGSVRRLAVVLVLVTLPKLLQEYTFHVLDVTPWPWVQRHILG